MSVAFAEDTVPIVEYERICGERDHWRSQALSAQERLSNWTAFAGCSNLTESQRIRTWAAVQIANASETAPDGWKHVSLFDLVTVAGIKTTPADDTPEAKRRAIKNATSRASHALALAEELGVIERTEPQYQYDDPDDPLRITSSTARVRPKLPPVQALRKIAAETEPRPAQKPRGIHVPAPKCPNCGKTEHIHIKCSSCGFYCTGEEYAQLEIERLEAEHEESENGVPVPAVQNLQPENVDNTEECDWKGLQFLQLAGVEQPESKAESPAVQNLHRWQEAEEQASWVPSIQPGRLPEKMQAYRQFVGYRVEKKTLADGTEKVDKIPVNVHTGRDGKSNDPTTWGTFEEALAAVDRYGLPGYGFVFTEDDPFVFIDIDGCRDPISGRVDGLAAAWIRRLESWAEISQSGAGVHVFVAGHKPGDRCKGKVGERTIEIYAQGRFAALSGTVIAGLPRDAEERQEQLEALYRMVFPQQAPASVIPRERPQLVRSDEQIVDRAMAQNGAKFDRLWRGDVSDYMRDGESGRHTGDLAFCGILAHAGADAGQIDRLWRQSGLANDSDRIHKWVRFIPGWGMTYGEHTIQAALAGRRP